MTVTKMNKTSYYEPFKEERIVDQEPFYIPVSDEIELFEAAYAQKIPVLLKGPTGCGKTRFIEHMAWRLNQARGNEPSSKKKSGSKSASSVPLITIACHEDLTASDLVGRYLLEGQETKWIDGPLTRAVKTGAICYLDEIVEARKDTTVLIHPLADYRRQLPIEKLGLTLNAEDGFLLCMSYNPGYQSALKDLKHSTRQRFMAIEFNYPECEPESRIIAHESGVSLSIAQSLARLGQKIRNLKDYGLLEGASTRLLVYVGRLINQGISPRRASQTALSWALTDDLDVQQSIDEVITSIFE
jgi:nitric oxide reductase NorQ protein